MPSCARLLAALERYDTLPAADALSAALDAVLGAGPPEHPDPARNQQLQQAHADASQAGLVMWDMLRRSPQGQEAMATMAAWAEERLSAWHSLKVNAIRSAFEADPTGTDLEGMRRNALINLRQGLTDHPDLVPDAHLLQALARGGHNFTWSQAVRELQQEQIGLPADNELLKKLCMLSANCFRYLVS